MCMGWGRGGGEGGRDGVGEGGGLGCGALFHVRLSLSAGNISGVKRRHVTAFLCVSFGLTQISAVFYHAALVIALFRHRCPYSSQFVLLLI